MKSFVMILAAAALFVGIRAGSHWYANHSVNQAQAERRTYIERFVDEANRELKLPLKRPDGISLVRLTANNNEISYDFEMGEHSRYPNPDIENLKYCESPLSKQLSGKNAVIIHKYRYKENLQTIKVALDDDCEKLRSAYPNVRITTPND